MTVLEFASVLAGPAVGQFFAELGAEVIKVENPRTGGDVTRTWKSPGEPTDDRSAYFSSVNWGKRSVAIDLLTDEGRAIAMQLAMRAQIVLSSFKPGDAEKLQVDYKTLSRHNPGLVYGQISGYGPENPRVGYDAIIQAEAGFMSMNGEPGGQSLKMPVALVDLLAAHHLKEGLLLALLEKSRSGRGRLVEVSLIQAALSSLANQGSNWLVGGKIPARQGSAHPNIAPYGELFPTSDDREILLGVGTDAQFNALCQVLGVADVADDERFRTNLGRVANRAELIGIIGQAIIRREVEELWETLTRARVPAAIVRNVREAVETPEARQLLLEHGRLKGLRTFAANTDTFSHILPPPRLGQDTRDILTTLLALSVENVENLLQKRVIV